MKLTITKFFLLAASGPGLLGCGSFSDQQVLTVAMYGISRMPASATGVRDPKFQNYQLMKVDLVLADGSGATTLFENEEERIFRIVDREQMIYSKPIEDLVETSYSSLQFTFAPEVQGGDSAENPLAFTLSNPMLTLSQAFVIEKAQDVTVQIKMHWANTLSDEAMTEPEYVLSMD